MAASASAGVLLEVVAISEDKDRKLLQLGINRDEALKHGYSRKGPWRMSGSEGPGQSRPLSRSLLSAACWQFPQDYCVKER